MTEQYRSGKVSFKDVRTFNLDEYCDLPNESPQQLLFVYGREPFLEGRYKARKCQFP